MHLLQILVLAVVQGAAELLPISSSAHVIIAEKLMGLDPVSPEMTLLLVMLHTGTMFAVIAYFWRSWQTTYFASLETFRANVRLVVIATIATGIVGLVLLELIKHTVAHNAPGFQIEQLFGNPKIIAGGLIAAGILIIVGSRFPQTPGNDCSLLAATWIGIIQGLCLPFRGFSRSGATISTGLAFGIGRRRAEEFSFALAVVLTPPVIAREAYRLYHAQASSAAMHSAGFMQLLAPSLVGMVLSFLAGLVALRWLSAWLEHGRWYLFGIYCLVASPVVLLLTAHP